MPYSQLNEQRILATIERLHGRIQERFPDASLAGVAVELHRVARDHARLSNAIHQPNWFLRALSALLIVASVAALVLVFASVRTADSGNPDMFDLVQGLESGLSMLFFLGAGIVLIASLELRRKRGRCLEALHQLRALAHVVDMHQLTKDPELALRPGMRTASSPVRTLTPFELARYLDYCSEMLSLMGKLAALYAQSFPDPQAVAAVDAIEDLTTGLARKVWQKIMILANHPDADDEGSVAAAPDARRSGTAQPSAEAAP